MRTFASRSSPCEGSNRCELQFNYVATCSSAAIQRGAWIEFNLTGVVDRCRSVAHQYGMAIELMGSVKCSSVNPISCSTITGSGIGNADRFLCEIDEYESDEDTHMCLIIVDFE